MTVAKAGERPGSAHERDVEDRAEALRAGAAQIAEWQPQLRQIAVSLSKGIAWAEANGWPWEAPAPGSSPETWPRGPKLMRRLGQFIALVVDLQMLTALPGHPRWCDGCHPGEKAMPSALWVLGPCTTHLAPDDVSALARAFGMGG